MTEKIQIQNVKKIGADGRPIKTEMVQCPKTSDLQPSRICKHCKHCRIHLSTFVKCTYADDAYKATLEPITVI